MRCTVLMVLFDGSLCVQKVLKYLMQGIWALGPLTELRSASGTSWNGYVLPSGLNASTCLTDTHTKHFGNFSLCIEVNITGRVNADV